MGIVSCLLLLGLLSGGSPAGAADEPDGAALYRRWCARCHGVTADGDGRDASLFLDPPPRLRGDPVLVRYTNAELEAWVRDGKRLELGLRPDVLREQSRRTEALYRHLERLPAIDWQTVEAGRETYERRCLLCHDEYGRPQAKLPKGVPTPPALATAQRKLSDTALREAVRHGRKGMTPLSPPIAAGNAAHLAAFARVLSPGYELYDRFCQGCHGIHGEGAGDRGDSKRPAFAFDESYFGRHSADWVIDRIWHMLRDAKARMPHFHSSLTSEEVRAILDSLRALEPPAAEEKAR